MSPFIIFAIVLTIAYILYYATLITMDLNTKPKDAEEATETISADDEEDDSGIMSRNVIEDTESGGFNIIDPSTSSEDNNIMEEATDHEEDILPDETPEVPPVTLLENDEESGIAESTEEESQEDTGISNIPFAGTASEEDVNGKPFEETDAFNPDLAQPQYGISTIIESPVDAAVQKNVDDLNQALLTNTKPKGNLKAPEEFVSLIQTRRETSNIDYHDEYTQC